MSSPTELVSAWFALNDAYAAERSAARVLSNPDHHRQSERAIVGLTQQHDDALVALDAALKGFLALTTRTRR